MKGIRGKPKPYGGTRPVIMNAGASPVGQAFAIRNCDAFFLQASRTSLEETAQKVATAKSRQKSREQLGVYTVGVVTCRPTKKEAEDYYHYSIVEHADGRRSTASSRSRTSRRRTRRRINFNRSARDMRKEGWSAHRRRPRPRRQPTDRSQPGGTDRDRCFAGQLCRRAAILLRGGLPRLERAGLREKRRP